MRQTIRPTPSVKEFEEEFKKFIDAGIFTSAEVHTAERITEAVFTAANSKATFLDLLAVAVAVWAPVNGHVCADLGRIDDQVLGEFRNVNQPEDSARPELPWPNASEWVAHLAGGPLVGNPVEADVDVTKPLVLKNDRLYLTRQWIDEGIVAKDLATRLSLSEIGLPAGADSWLAEVFGTDTTGKQYLAVKNSLSHNTTVLLGGPGTGKTYTIAAMLHAFHREHQVTSAPDAAALRVALAAPTAKAARQIGSSIEGALKSESFPAEFSGELSRIGREASTIHRLLGTMRQSRGRFRHNRRNFLPYNIVIVDEVSMVSLALMARLLEALAPETKLVLVGDGEQLKSVENGAVLPEIASLRQSGVKFPIVTLTENRRQMNAPGGKLNRIGVLAEMMRAPEDKADPGRDVDAIFEFLRVDDDEITWSELSDDDASPVTPGLVLEGIDDDLDAFTKAKVAALAGKESEALDQLARIRVLCGHRVGRFGVKEWNSALGKHLEIPLDRTSPGLPLLNTKNEVRTGLVNGDTGIVASLDGTPYAIFRTTRQATGEDGGESASTDEIRRFEPTSLESVEISFATTIHKAQGSQYETAIVVCPPHTSPLATRELVYTAATRATHRLVIIASPRALRHAIETNTRRESGLADRILANRPG
jgi:exodeoxyribonuclease V alpha subunit